MVKFIRLKVKFFCGKVRILKIYNAVFYTKPLDVEKNLERAMSRRREAVERKADLAVFPCRCLSGEDLGILRGSGDFRGMYNRGIKRLSKALGDCVLARDYIAREGGFVPAFYKNGELIKEKEISLGGLRVRIVQSPRECALTGADLYVYNSRRPVVAGQRPLLRRFLARAAKKTGGSVDVNLGGLGRTSHPYVYMPSLGFFTPRGGDMTMDRGRYLNAERSVCRGKRGPGEENADLPPLEFSLHYCENPLIPTEVGEEEYCLDLFSLQTKALGDRLGNLGMKSAVVALSGGLDSALALLVTVNAFDSLGLPRSGIKVITMPGFGTSGTTRKLAGELARGLGLKLWEADITDSCKKALEDIGHDGKTRDVTFENVQARMRTLYGLSVANMTGGLMVGTGDLSEEALGFSTYGGDRLASYNVNSSISKTVIRAMLPYVTKLPGLSGAGPRTEKILSIPVSPELVPHGGKILQRTEDILAPYKLVDFYTYCFVVAGLSPERTRQKAEEVFGEEFPPRYLKEKGDMYYSKFIKGQFKRSRAPEGAVLTHARLFGDRRLPSDGSPAPLISSFRFDGGER